MNSAEVAEGARAPDGSHRYLDRGEADTAGARTISVQPLANLNEHCQAVCTDLPP
jgi:hypothetical protein